MQRCNRALIIPTYLDHFNYIEDFLCSVNLLVLDSNMFDICFILSSKDEQNVFDKRFSKYKKKLNIYTYNIEEILLKYGISINSSILLDNIGKYSFQTIKKLYGVFFLQYEQSYIMDSESIFIKPVHVNSLFDAYFESPFVLFYPFSCYPKQKWQNSLNYITTQNVSNIFNDEGIENFYFDGFNWFYDINIVNNMFKFFNNDLYNTIVNYAVKNKSEDYKSQAIFECIFYYQYIYKNNSKYHYNFINTIPLIEDKVGQNLLKEKLNIFAENNTLYPVLMHSWELMQDEDISKFAQIYRDLNFRIARLYVNDISAKKLITFLDNSDICLAVSTENLREHLVDLCGYKSSVTKYLNTLFNKRKSILTIIWRFIKNIGVGKK